MNFMFFHLMCWNYLIDLITDNRNRNSKNRSNSGDGNNKGGRAPRARPPLLSQSLVLLVGSVVSVNVSGLCDQDDQVVPAHQVDDMDEVHELAPVHQVDPKDEFHFFHFILSIKDISPKRCQKVDRHGFEKLHFSTLKKVPGTFLGV